MGYFAKFSNKGVPFMEGRDKGDKKDMLDKPLHIVDFGFIRGTDGDDFAVMLFDELPDVFFFGNALVTEMLQQVEADDMREGLKDVTITFTERKSKQSGRMYVSYDIEE